MANGSFGTANTGMKASQFALAGNGASDQEIYEDYLNSWQGNISGNSVQIYSYLLPVIGYMRASGYGQ